MKYKTEEERIEAKRAARKRWREKNPDYNKKRTYTEEQKEKRRENKREWYKNNKEHVSEYNKEYSKKYREENRDILLAKKNEYSKTHNEERSTYMKKYNSTKIGRAVNLASSYKQTDEEYNRGECTITAKWILENIFNGQVCHYCGKADWRELGCDRIDNSLPHTPENCVPCCKMCNIKKGTMSYDEYMKKIGKIKCEEVTIE